MREDMRYIEQLRSQAIGFEMKAFYDRMLQEIREARFRSLMVQEYDL